MIFFGYGFQYLCQQGNLIKLLLDDGRIPINSSIFMLYVYQKISNLLLADKRVDPSSINDSTFGEYCVNAAIKFIKILLKDKRLNPTDQNNKKLNLY